MGRIKTILTAAAFLMGALPPVGRVLGDEGPRLDLMTRRVECASNFSGWKFRIYNHGDRPVTLSDLQVRLWVQGDGMGDPVVSQSWIPGYVSDASNYHAVAGVTVLAQPMRRFRAYPLDEKADWEVILKCDDPATLPPGGLWQGGYFSFHYQNWGDMAPDSDYSKAPECGDGTVYFENPKVGLYYEGRLVGEWLDGDHRDPQTGLSPIPPTGLTGKEAEGGIVSPRGGEQVCGLVGIAVRPGTARWEVQWAPEGENSWEKLAVVQKSGYWEAQWDTRPLKKGDYRIRLEKGAGTAGDGDGRSKSGDDESVTVKVGTPSFEQSFGLGNNGVPGGIAHSGSGLDVLDVKNQAVQVLDSTGSPVEQLGTYGTRIGEMNQAQDLSATEDGTIYVADTGNGRIDVFGSTESFFGEKILVSPTVVRAASGGFYVLDGGVVHRFDGNHHYLYSGRLEGTDKYMDVAIDDAGRLYLVNANGPSIDVYSPEFARRTQWTDLLPNWNPLSLSFSQGRLWLTDGGNDEVVKLGLDGNRLASWGGYGSAHGQFDQPFRALDGRNGSLYISDPGNRRVESFGIELGQFPVTQYTPGTEGDEEISAFTALPNPFNPLVSATTLSYLLSRAAAVHLSIQDQNGQVLYQQDYPEGNFGGKAGLNQVVWDGLSGGSPLPDGSYKATLQAVAAGGRKVQAQVAVLIQSAAQNLSPTVTEVVEESSSPTPTLNVSGTPSPTFTPSAETPTDTPLAVPPTSTFTPVPSTPTFTPAPPTDTATPVPPTFTFTPLLPTPTQTPVRVLDIDDLDIWPAVLPVASAKIVKVGFELNKPATIEVRFVLQSTGQVYKDLTVQGVAGENKIIISDFDRQLVAGAYGVIVTATDGNSTAQAIGIFTVTP